MALRLIEAKQNASVGGVKLAARAMHEAERDRERAHELLRRWITEDRALFEQLIEPMIDDNIDAWISKADRQLRADLRVTVGPNPDIGAAGIVAMVQRTLHEFPLPGGKRLGSATPADVLAAARYYRTMEASNRREARWFELIHEAMHGGSTVEKVLPAAALERLRRQVEEE